MGPLTAVSLKRRRRKVNPIGPRILLRRLPYGGQIGEEPHTLPGSFIDRIGIVPPLCWGYLGLLRLSALQRLHGLLASSVHLSFDSSGRGDSLVGC